MKNKNDYGFYSGGYIFDRLDRTALRVARRESKLKHAQLYTETSFIRYHKQLCDLNLLHTVINKADWVRAYEYEVQIELWQHAIKIASACFNFHVAAHNYCETKGKKK